MENKKLANPAVIGLAGFGLTTFLLQLHNLELIGLGPVMAMGIIFGGLAQFIAGFHEQKMGNNFGYTAFVSYGSFWIGLSIIWILNHYKVYESNGTDVGYYLVAWTIYTGIMLIAALRIHKAMTLTFATLFLGFFLLDLGHFGMPVCNKIAAIVLLICAFSAWYMMAAIVINDLAGKEVLKFGKPFIAKK